MADGHDPATGRFVKGHKKHPAAGRPPNAVNVITKTLREKVLDGFGDGHRIRQRTEDGLSTSCCRIAGKDDAPR